MKGAKYLAAAVSIYTVANTLSASLIIAGVDSAAITVSMAIFIAYLAATAIITVKARMENIKSTSIYSALTVAPLLVGAALCREIAVAMILAASNGFGSYLLVASQETTRNPADIDDETWWVQWR